jgi:3-oxoacyl-[acyl-carrier-protein] synthase II
MMAGGAESTVSPLGWAVSPRPARCPPVTTIPLTASRPWDKDRDGFVLGEGAGVMVLEEYEHAKARGAKIYAELLGFGMSADAYHMTSPLEDGSGGSMAQAAMKNAGINPDQVNYVNAHGTSTPLGDKAEVQGIKRTFGDAREGMVVSTRPSR